MADQTIVNICVDRGVERYGVLRGARLGGRVALFIFQWCTYVERHDGQEPSSVRSFAKWAQRSHQGSDQVVAEFRDLFPEHDSPVAFVGVPLTGGARGVPATAPLTAFSNV